jgi:hypothetical protein
MKSASPEFVRGQLSWAVVGLTITGLGMLVYRDTLTLPFYFDDLGIISWMERNTLWGMWGTPGGMSYYRPITFFLRKLIALAMGGYQATVHHAINLATHIVSGLLVAWLAADLWRGKHRQVRVLISGAIFVLFPFSYQAVPFVTALPHTLVAVFVLGAVASYLRATGSGGRIWWVPTVLLAILAPLTHENGLMLVPLLIVMESTRRGQLAWFQQVRRPLPLLIPAGGYLLAWMLVPRKGAVPSIPHLETLFQNGIYFLQGVAFPLESLAGLWHRAGIGDMAAAGLVAAVSLSLIVVIQRKRGSRLSLFPWLWIGLTLLPAWLMLKFDYVINGPRLLYLAAAGIAWLWADALLDLWTAVAKPHLQVVGPLITSLVLLLPGTLFIRDAMVLHRMGGEMIQQVTEHTLETASQEGDPVLFVNLPSWLAYKENTYPLGHEGVTLLPEYTSFPEIVFANSGRWLNGEAIEFGNIVLETPYYYGVFGPAQDWDSLAVHIWRSQKVFLARPEPDHITVLPIGEPLSGAPLKTPVAAFSDRIYLETMAVLKEDGRIRLELVWHCAEQTDVANVFVHALNSGGILVAQADGPPVGGMLPFWLWTTGDRVRDLRWLADSAPDRIVELRVGIVDSSGERLPAVDKSGLRYPNDAVSVQVRE